MLNSDLAKSIRKGKKNHLQIKLHAFQIVSCSYKIKEYFFSILTKSFQDFTLDMYFRQFWQDPRLSFERKTGMDKLVVGAEYISLIWVPDTFFVNEKTAYFHKATTDNQFVRIFHTGDILRSIR